MQFVEPKLYLIGETKLLDNDQSDIPNAHDYFKDRGIQDWLCENVWKNTEDSDCEKLTEIMSRGCYDSFVGDGKLNPNVTQVREGNKPHLKNIIKTGHGSVMEHTWLNWEFTDVSRVFTHELVRHRQGTAFSQQSLRYVRLRRLSAFLPSVLKDSKDYFEKVFEQLEEIQEELEEMYKKDLEGDFAKKKALTSAFRRLAPIGLATNIGFSCNFRALRFILEQRTDPAAEEEIRFVFEKVWDIVSKRYPNMMQGYTAHKVDGYVHVRPHPDFMRKV